MINTKKSLQKNTEPGSTSSEVHHTGGPFYVSATISPQGFTHLFSAIYKGFLSTLFMTGFPGSILWRWNSQSRVKIMRLRRPIGS